VILWITIISALVLIAWGFNNFKIGLLESVGLSNELWIVEPGSTLQYPDRAYDRYDLPRVFQYLLTNVWFFIDQSRKRGTLESDLLLSTFADANLPSMTKQQLDEYDRFLDENDWDIYYWTTQEPTPTSMEYAEGAGPGLATPSAEGKLSSASSPNPPASGEWAQTIGTFKPAYRPVPQRWKNSEILSLLRKHVKDRSAGGVTESPAKVGGQGLSQSVQGTGGGGLGFMPPIRNMDA
jgi:hypothetical protein